jgi:hypothetical protein
MIGWKIHNTIGQVGAKDATRERADWTCLQSGGAVYTQTHAFQVRGFGNPPAARRASHTLIDRSLCEVSVSAQSVRAQRLGCTSVRPSIRT